MVVAFCRLCTIVVCLTLIGAANAQSGVYQPGPNTLFYLPLDGPNAGAPENCSVLNPSLLSYVPDRFNNPNSAIQVSATGLPSDYFYIQCANTMIAGSTSQDFTVGYWAKVSQLPGDGNCSNGCDYHFLIILAENSSNGGCDKFITIDINSGGYANACQGSADGNIDQFTSSTSVVDATWHSHVWVFDHTNQLITFYLDGQQNGTAPLPDPSLIPTNTQYLAGAENGSFALNGELDDFWIEDYAWSQAEVTRYLAPGGSGTIQVTTNLSESTFTITGPASFNGSGTSSTFAYAPPGTYTITFGAISGYATPSPQTQTLNVGAILSFTGTYQTCTVPNASVNDNYAYNVIAASSSGGGCQWTLTVTNSETYLWLKIGATPIGSVSITPADSISAVYSKLGILPPGESINYSVGLTEPDQSVEVVASLTGLLNRAMLANLLQVVIDATNTGTVITLSLQDAADIAQLANHMPDLGNAVADFFHTTCSNGTCGISPEYRAGVIALAAFFTNSTELDVFATLLVKIGGDALEAAVVAALKDPGFLASALAEVYSNIRSAFSESTAGAIFLTAQ